jgi:hypothetical protein
VRNLGGGRTGHEPDAIDRSQIARAAGAHLRHPLTLLEPGRGGAERREWLGAAATLAEVRVTAALATAREGPAARQARGGRGGVAEEHGWDVGGAGGPSDPRRPGSSMAGGKGAAKAQGGQGGGGAGASGGPFMMQGEAGLEPFSGLFEPFSPDFADLLREVGATPGGPHRPRPCT